jgi:hypothetical protein
MQAIYYILSLTGNALIFLIKGFFIFGVLLEFFRKLLNGQLPEPSFASDAFLALVHL